MRQFKILGMCLSLNEMNKKMIYHKIHIFIFDAFMNFRNVFMPFVNVLDVYQRKILIDL